MTAPQIFDPATLVGGKSLEQLKAEQGLVFGRADFPKQPQKPLVPATDAGRRLLEDVAKPPALPVAKPRTFNHLMGWNEARKCFFETVKSEAAWQGKSFEYTSENIPVIQDLLRYFTNNPESEIPLNKGLYLFGEYGCGKTFLLRCFKVFCETYGLGKAFEFSLVPKIYADAIASGECNFTPYYTADRCFDDAGFHNASLKSFGNEVKPLEMILTDRYDRHDCYGQLTHITSNLAPENLAMMFDERVFDRCLQMFHPVYMGGKSFRA